ncbi:protein SSUH2 homolog isoform X2 [Dioscorea cayenensis subsp. rotundata]|uniref:Protein SSUH2 homolog isoform X2 n=1 Tax=Dioscorea cayennensis subsp. rotundata TaxID=55577 RepID=A0AB40CYT8_DIOCR|nr:protein SSUH2 homolog isoform X2 [Dioscorea cayenensis subsp. rotundata]
MEQALLSEEVEQKGEEKWRVYQSLGRSASVHVPTSLSGRGEEVSVDEIRSASIHSHPYYPPSLHGALVSSPEPDAPPYAYDQAIVHQGGFGQYPSGNMSREFGRKILDEVEIRQLLIDHVGHRCCWGSRPARRWKIAAVEDCNVYVGTLETFMEEREIVKEREPYLKGEIDEKDKGPELGVWELDLRSEFPLLFVSHKETKVKVPHSESIQKCTECEGRGEIACHTCNANQEPGFYKEKQMSRCPACHGRGLIAHQDGSDTTCTKCNGKGLLPCATCGSRGLIKCETCMGRGSILTRSIALVNWRTLSNRKVSATTAAASVPDEVFHKARGVQLYNTQSYQCTPAYFADSYFLNQFSSEVIADRSPVPPSARIICERHIISVVPVTRVTMVHRKQSFSFYIIGISNEIYIKDYPSKFCWGLCCCLEWLKM